MKSSLPTLANAASVLAVQLFALVTLAPANFGLFSVQYLLFAFGSSLSLSLISEAWLRADLQGRGRAEWRAYSSVTLYLSGAAGAVTLGLSLLIEPLRSVAWLGAVAVAAAVYRSSARYYSVRMGERRGVISGDLAGLGVASLVWVVLFSAGLRDLWIMTAVWAASAVAAAALSKRPKILRPQSLGEWRRGHAQQIRPLLRDSLLMDAGSIGTPYLLAPVLGLAGFGVYRAISNVAAPVRLVLNPIRPQLASAAIETQRSGKRVGIVVAASVIFGGAAYLGVLLVGMLPVSLGSLSEIVTFAVPAAVFVSASFLGHYFYIVARSHLSGRRLLAGRIIQTGLAIIVPIAGVLLGGLSGAIWGYAGCTAFSALVWMALVLRPSRA
ncbi:hypothetical protein [Cryobacterium sp. M91]|uniref:hypothetical protein n=1 Tax=Cryobacterium sp. M91 TaxID=2048294 RepID=UPI0011AFF973|nr:hypothetical protein [Cryobacterium sp. M91]